MTWKAMVQPDFVMGGIAVHLGRADGPGKMAVVGPLELTFEATTGDPTTPPALRLPDALGRALLDALATHYGSTGDARTTRADLLAERQRIERLTEALIQIATSVAANAKPGG